jgi:hypothetical protein
MAVSATPDDKSILTVTSKLSGTALFAAPLSNAMLGDFSEQTRKSSADSDAASRMLAHQC